MTGKRSTRGVSNRENKEEWRREGLNYVAQQTCYYVCSCFPSSYSHTYSNVYIFPWDNNFSFCVLLQIGPEAMV